LFFYEENKIMRSISKKKKKKNLSRKKTMTHKKRPGEVAEGVGPEFKPQNRKKRKKRN
jgi:hypothetical protein